MASLATRLVEAEAAYHRLMIGESAVEVRDQSGESVKFGFANRAALARYIADLKRQIAGTALPSATIRVTISKGL